MIYVKEGIYDEVVLVGKKFLNLTMYGDGNTKTVVTGNLNYNAGVQTFKTATFCTNIQFISFLSVRFFSFFKN